MAKKHLSTEKMNEIMASMKDGEERHYPEYDMSIRKREPVRAPGEGLQIISDQEMEAFEERQKNSKTIAGPDRAKELDDPNFKHTAKIIYKKR